VNSNKIRAEIQELAGWLRKTRDEGESKIVRLAGLVLTVQEKKLYREWKDPATKKFYPSFDSWLRAEIKESRASIYRFMGVKEYLKSVPIETLETIGSSRCFELAKVGREKPSLLPRFLKEIKEHPDIPVVSLRSMVANSLAGGSFDSGRYEEVCFVVKSEDMAYVKRALVVMQAEEAVESPDTAAGRGVHLVSLCQEYLAGDEAARVLKALEEAGAFKNTPFTMEDDGDK